MNCSPGVFGQGCPVSKYSHDSLSLPANLGLLWSWPFAWSRSQVRVLEWAEVRPPGICREWGCCGPRLSSASLRERQTVISETHRPRWTLPGRRRAGRGIMSQSSVEQGPKSHNLFVKTDKRGGGSTRRHRIRAIEPAGGELEGNTSQDSYRWRDIIIGVLSSCSHSSEDKEEMGFNSNKRVERYLSVLERIDMKTQKISVPIPALSASWLAWVPLFSGKLEWDGRLPLPSPNVPPTPNPECCRVTVRPRSKERHKMTFKSEQCWQNLRNYYLSFGEQ